MLEQQIEQELKAALLARDRRKADTLRGIKSALLYAKVEKRKRDSGLSRDEEIAVLTRESKKRAESAEAYQNAGSSERADSELAEKAIIDAYLPAQMSDSELSELIDKTISDQGATDLSGMGKVISAVREKAAGTADGARIAQLVKERLAQ